MKKLLLTVSLLFCADVLAGSVYQCTVDGVTEFSQTPCDNEYKTIEVDTSGHGASSKSSKNEVIEQCLSLIKRRNTFKDPYSLRIESDYERWETDKSGGRRVLVIEVAAKNSYGAYDGSKHYSCYLTHDGTNLSQVQSLIN